MTALPLIAMACSGAKVAGDAVMPAIDRYDGPMWKTLRAALVDRPMPTVWVLSAKYGFIPASTPIADYDELLTEAKARKIAALPSFDAQIFAAAVLSAGPVLFAGGDLYRRTMRLALGTDAADETDGSGIGYQRKQLREWIEEHCR